MSGGEDVFGANLIYNAYEDGRGVLVFDGTITSMGGFSELSSLATITIPNSVTSINNDAFRHCSNLVNISIPNSIVSIGEYDFAGCSSLASVYCKPTTPPTVGGYVLSYNASGRKIYVPTESVDAYKAASYWSDYASSIEPYEF